MKILSIETSCDETAVSIVDAKGDFPDAVYSVLGNALFSQVDIHREYGGVFPSVAKREHSKTLVPMLKRALEEASLLRTEDGILSQHHQEIIEETLQREPELAESLTAFFESNGKPDIDLIAVTNGPGLEPALWVGVNFARTLSQVWNIPVVPVDHMEGHILSSVYDGEKIPPLVFPALALLISGGHTELVLIPEWGSYTVIGETRDDAVGEAFDKVARMLGLPYPGGPEIGSLAALARTDNIPEFQQLPLPMLDSADLDFSFSGLKTAVRYAIDGKDLTDNEKAAVARDFEDVVVKVLLKKSQKAVDAHDIRSLILGGGVTANTYLKERFGSFFTEEYPDLAVYFPDRKLSTDNSIMIALAGHAHAKEMLQPEDAATIKADGNLSL